MGTRPGEGRGGHRQGRSARAAPAEPTQRRGGRQDDERIPPVPRRGLPRRAAAAERQAVRPDRTGRRPAPALPRPEEPGRGAGTDRASRPSSGRRKSAARTRTFPRIRSAATRVRPWPRARASSSARPTPGRSSPWIPCRAACCGPTPTARSTRTIGPAPASIPGSRIFPQQLADRPLALGPADHRQRPRHPDRLRLAISRVPRPRTGKVLW